MWSLVVWFVGFSLALVQYSRTRTLDDAEVDGFPSEESPSPMKKICGRSIFMTPTNVRCPDRYHYNSFHNRCVKRFRLVRTEEQLLHQLNTVYGSHQKDVKPQGTSDQKANTKGKLNALFRNFTLTHPGLKIRHSGRRQANKKETA